MRHIYKVTKKYGQRGAETSLPNRFNTLDEAKGFVNDKLNEDIAMGVNTTIYLIYEDDEFHSDYDASKVEAPSHQEESGAAGGQGKGASFRPTPLNMAPRPAGSPQNWVKDDEEEEEDKNK